MDINNNTQKAEFGDEKESNNCKDFELTASNQKNNDIELSFTDPTGNSQNELIIIIHTDNNSVEVIKKTPDPKPVATTGTTTNNTLSQTELADLEKLPIVDIEGIIKELFENNEEGFNEAIKEIDGLITIDEKEVPKSVDAEAVSQCSEYLINDFDTEELPKYAVALAIYLTYKDKGKFSNLTNEIKNKCN